MGTLIRNGITYSGGGDIGTQLTQAEFNQLTPTQQATGTYWITDAAGGDLAVDSALSATSEHAVQNKVITSALNDKQPKTMSTTIAGQTTVEGCLTTLNANLSAINNLAYSSSGLTAGGCSITHGGYAKLGNLVIVNIRFTVSEQSPYIVGFPVPKAGTAGFAGYDGLNEKAAFGYLNDSGQLHIPNAYGSTGAINVSFSYLTN